ncbi:MAG: WhiB family transcriptional regulator [Egibacteraceae bacterium]
MDVPGQAWRDRAACLGQDTERFYPAGTTGVALDLTAQAKAVCAGCDVRSQCLDYAMGTNQGAGIWGGMTEDERRASRRSRQWRRSG